MNGYTKLYKEEIDLLYKTNSIAALKVYTHLKDKYRYYKQDIYDYMSCMSQSLEMSERTIKDVIKRLKNVGLIECRREWVKSDGVPKSSNYYSFPIVDMIEKSENKEEETPKEEQKKTEVVGTSLSAEVQKVITENEDIINMNVEQIARYYIYPKDIGETRKDEALNKLTDLCTDLEPNKSDELCEHIHQLIIQKQNEIQNELQYNKN